MYSSPAPEVSHECDICGGKMILVEEIPTVSGESQNCIDTFVCQNPLCQKVEPKIMEVCWSKRKCMQIPHHFA